MSMMKSSSNVMSASLFPLCVSRWREPRHGQTGCCFAPTVLSVRSIRKNKTSFFASCQGYLAGGVFYDGRTETTNSCAPQRWTGLQENSLGGRHIRKHGEVLLPQQRIDGQFLICRVPCLRQAAGADAEEKTAEVLLVRMSGEVVEQEP